MSVRGAWPLIDIIVRNGTVELWGTILDERKRLALILAAENVHGVEAVRDHLVYVEPMSGMTFGPPEAASGM